ncbi:N-acyl-D-aspartate/D-glutamate deacylase [Desulfosporosinus acidiphilus SJ4]|uniref:N-acyl-D-aspartate/D-glutamate deacylase n=1 Tax=Desulfosporosinus acidiphilus (strain DSM 22704 / JCM 16185 / SJ4) TaxID=646529 RepID=I4D2Z6_DESAJ|nr:D-aminoacylase [Desulfosporosinus acidiphilus]AFM40170.1 N-acyl-D-aspartate/D-glutamate deacylase [Desulfosporosinus acidiphilus SJ4]
MLDLAIIGGLVVDGSGTPPEILDLGIMNGRIAEIKRDLSSASPAAQVINAEGHMVTPGFIDVHSHCDLVPFTSGSIRESRIRQGVTTEIAGQCGLGPAPYSSGMEAWRSYLTPILGQGPQNWNWPVFSTFLHDIQRSAKTNNVAYLLGHGAVRAKVLGLNNHLPSAKDLANMCSLVAEAMSAGALGISYGLAYLPGMFASHEELVALSSVVASHDGIMMIHIRSHSLQVREAMTEALKIAQESGVKLQISHMRSYANRHFGISGPELIHMVEKARSEGIDVTFDEHPYQAGSTLLSQVLPPWAKEGGSPEIIKRLKDPVLRTRLKNELKEDGPEYPGWDNFVGMVEWPNIMISSTFKEQNKWAEGLRADQLISRHFQTVKAPAEDVIDQIAKLLISEDCQSSMVMHHLFAEEDMVTLLQHPLCQIGSDGIPTGKPHPRLFGTFPKFLGEYVREKKLLTWEEAIKRVTGTPAQRLNLRQKGLIKEGYSADLVIFNPDEINILEDYNNPEQPLQGIDYTILNGRIVLAKGELLSPSEGQLIVR